MDSAGKSASITFREINAMENVLRQRNHEYDGVPLKVLPHHLELGLLNEPPHHPPSIIPNSFNLACDPDVIQFLLASDFYRQKIDKWMEQEYGKINWPSHPNSQVEVSCTLCSTTPNVGQRALRWERRITEVWGNAAAQIVKEEVKALNDVMEEFREKTEQIASGLINIKVVFGDDGSSVIILGLKEQVDPMYQKLKKLHQDLVQTLQKKRERTKHQYKIFKPHHIELLQTNKLDEDLRKKYDDLNVEFEEKCINLEGQTEQVEKAKGDIGRIVSKIIKKTQRVPPGVFKLLQHQEVKREIYQEWQVNSLRVRLQLERKDAVIFALNDEEAKRAMEMLDKRYGVKQEFIKDNRKLDRIGLDQFVKGLNGEFKTKADVQINEGVTKIYITAKEGDMGGLIQRIRKYIGDNTAMDIEIKIDAIKGRLIDKHLRKEIFDIGSTHESDFDFDLVEGQTLLKARVKQVAYQPINDEIRKLIDGIATDEYKVKKPGMWQYFASSSSQTFLDSVETKHKVILQVGDTMRVEKSNTPVTDLENSRPNDVLKVDDKTIRIDKGYIIASTTDVIVNVSGDDDKYGSMTEAIFKAAGESVKGEWKKRFSEKKPKQVFVSEPGNLGVRGIIHIIAPQYDHRESEETSRDTLTDLVTICLNMATEKRYKTVTLPLIGKGQGFPLSTIAEALAEAVPEFLRSEDHTLELVEILDHEANCIEKVRAKFMGTETPPEPHPKDSTSGGRSSAGSKGNPSLKKVDQESLSANGITIKVSSDSIASKKADAVIAPIGAITKALCLKGGKELNDEIENNARKIKHGNVEVTRGRKLNCKYVIYGPCPSWPRGNDFCETKIREMVRNGLAKAEDHRCSSVVIPAIGTGRNAVPKDVSAAILFSEVILFTKKARYVKKIKFIIYEKDVDTFKVFKEEIDKQVKKVEWGDTKRTRRPALHSIDQHGAPGEWQVTDTVTVSLHQGDILQERGDAIVCSTDVRYPLKAGAAKAVSSSAGSAFVNDFYREKDDFGRKHVLCLDGGNLHVKSVLLLAAMKDAPSWQHVLDECFRKAESESMRNISCLALGTGAGKVPIQTMAEVMYKAIKEFTDGSPAFACKIRIVIPSDRDDVMSSFRQVLKSMKESKGGFTGMMTRFVETVKGYIPGASGSDTSRGVTEGVEAAAAPVPSHTTRTYNMPKVIVIHAINRAVIGKASEEIQRKEEDEYLKSELTRDADKETISQLGSEEKGTIEEIGKTLGVFVEFMPNGGISIEGHKDQVNKATVKITNVLRDADRLAKNRAEASLTTSQVQWYYRENDEWKKYDTEINAQIEKAKRENNDYAEWKEKQDTSSITVRVYFDRMVEQVDDDPISTEVKREDASIGALPQEWSDMPDDSDLHLVDLSPSCAEYKEFVQEMERTTKGTNIVKIERIQNITLYKQYAASRAKMFLRPTAKDTHEKHLWHGTSPDSIGGINKSGFDRGYHGKNATRFGKGAYFARDFSYSDGFCTPDSSGYKHIYLCKVLTGEYTKGDGSMNVPPRNPRVPGENFDSVVDNPVNPSIYVIFRDCNAYPAYIMTYQ